MCLPYERFLLLFVIVGFFLRLVCRRDLCHPMPRSRKNFEWKQNPDYRTRAGFQCRHASHLLHSPTLSLFEINTILLWDYVSLRMWERAFHFVSLMCPLPDTKMHVYIPLPIHSFHLWLYLSVHVRTCSSSLPVCFDSAFNESHWGRVAICLWKHVVTFFPFRGVGRTDVVGLWFVKRITRLSTSFSAFVAYPCIIGVTVWVTACSVTNFAVRLSS